VFEGIPEYFWRGCASVFEKDESKQVKELVSHELVLKPLQPEGGEESEGDFYEAE